MKLGKEEIQKIVLGVLLFAILIYGYFEMLLGPLKSNRGRSQARIEELTKKLREAKGQIRRVQELEAEVPVAEQTVQAVKAMIPPGAPVAWFPPRVAEQFNREGLEKAATRMTGETTDKDLSGFRRMTWSVDLAKVEFIPFAQALADFENNEPLAEITSLQIEAGNEDVELQRAALNVRTTVTQ